MSFPHLERHRNGKYYIHWTVERRSMRQSTKTDEERAALVAFARWILSRYTGDDGPDDAVRRRTR